MKPRKDFNDHKLQINMVKKWTEEIHRAYVKAFKILQGILLMS
jgi:hypothetical protein